jgi:hypothetical protein
MLWTEEFSPETRFLHVMHKRQIGRNKNLKIKNMISQVLAAA